jgi:hypothetical protein
MAQDNPFMAIRDRDQWGIEQVMQHKIPDYSNPTQSGRHPKRVMPVVTVQPTFTTQTYNFVTETDQAKINVAITNFGVSFIVDITSDQVIQGWLLKKQSTRETFLRGRASDNSYKCRISVNRPYLKDFGLTVYVTEDSDPAFVQLF